MKQERTENMNMLAVLAPVLGVIALLFAVYLSRKVSAQDAGTERMKEIAAFIHEGAQAFLMAEYRILVVFVVILFVGVGVCFLCRICHAICCHVSGTAGFVCSAYKSL